MENTTNRAIEIAGLIIRQRKGSLNTKEQEQLDSWVSKHPANRAVFEELTDEARLLEAIRNLQTVDPEPALRRTMQRLNLEKASNGRIISHTFFRYAAAAVLFMVVGVAVYRYFQKQEKPPIPSVTVLPATHDVAPGGQKAILTLSDRSTILLDNAGNGELALQGDARIVKQANGQITYQSLNKGRGQNEIVFNTLTTPRGGQYQIDLPDGTKAWLNAASSITYPSGFSGGKRNVSITGEVYFEVAHNPKIPFAVSINKTTQVEVLGTHFNVNAYSDEPTIKTTLLEGAVNIQSGNQTKRLKPGQQAKIITRISTGSIRIISDANIEQVMSWKNGAFSFKDATLKEVMREISRWYDVDVVYEKESDRKEQHFGGDIERSLNLSLVLRVLEKSQVHFRVEGKKLIVMP